MNGINNNLAKSFNLSTEDEKEIHDCTESIEANSEKVPRYQDNVESFCPKIDIDYLFKSRYQQLKGFIRKRVGTDEDAEDLAQNTYMEAIKKATNFKGLSRPDVWLFGIALNMVRNHRKKESNRNRVWEETLQHDTDLYEEVENPSDLLEKTDFVARLEEAVSRLPEDMMQVFNAVIVENLSYQQAAEQMGVPTGTIRSRLSRAREKLKIFII